MIKNYEILNIKSLRNDINCVRRQLSLIIIFKLKILFTSIDILDIHKLIHFDVFNKKFCF